MDMSWSKKAEPPPRGVLPASWVGYKNSLPPPSGRVNEAAEYQKALVHTGIDPANNQKEPIIRVENVQQVPSQSDDKMKPSTEVRQDPHWQMLDLTTTEGKTLYYRAELGDMNFLKRYVSEGKKLDERVIGWSMRTLIYSRNYDGIRFLMDLFPDNVDSFFTFLLTAVMCGDATSVGMICSMKGGNIQIEYNNGQNILHKAVVVADLEIVEILVDAGVELDLVDAFNETPLCHALLHDRYSFECAEYLVERGASVDLCVPLLSILQEDFEKERKEKSIDFFIKHKVDINVPNKDGVTVAEWCIVNDRTLLKKFGGQIRIQTTGSRLSLTRRAAESGDIETLKFIKEHGGDLVEFVDGFSPFIVAYMLGHVGCAQCILDCADIDDLHLSTAMYQCVECGNEEGVKFLLQKKVSPMAHGEIGDTSPYHRAYQIGAGKLVKLFSKGYEWIHHLDQILAVPSLYRYLREIIDQEDKSPNFDVSVSSAVAWDLFVFALNNDDEEMLDLLHRKG